MAMNKTTYLRNKLLDHVLRAVDYAEPATVYLALFTAAPGIAGGGTEVSGGSYARKAITFGNAASAGDIANTVAVVFDQATADWGDIGWGAICDAVSAGNQLYNGALTAAQTVLNNGTITFGIGEIDVSER